MARSGDRPQSRPRRAASATAAVRRTAPELVADVRDVAVHRVLAQDQLLGDLLVAQPARDQRQHLALSAGEQHRRRLSGQARRSFGREHRTQRPRHRLPIAGPREVGAPVERDQRRPRDRRRELAAELVGDRAIATAVHHQRRRTYLLQLCADVVAVDELQQRRRGLRARRGALVARQPLLLDTVGVTQEDVGQQPRPQPPMRTHGSDDRFLHLRRGDRGSIGIRAIEQQTIHPLGEASRERDRRATAGRAADQHDLLQRQLVEHRAQQRNVTVERQILVAHLAIGHADTEPVVAHQRVALADRLPEAPERLIRSSRAPGD